jgi:hypothetical protein
MDEKQDMKGCVKIILKDRAGRIVKESEVKNLIVSSGKSLVANLFRGELKTPVTHIAVGTGKKTPSVDDENLESEIAPRKKFEKNIFTSEQCASLILKTTDGIETVKFISNFGGSNANKLQIKVSKARAQSVNVFVRDVSVGNEPVETFENLDWKPASARYIETVINGASKYIRAKVLANKLPAPTEDYIYLSGGSDAVVTLAATFDYNECNTLLTEAGIFNSEESGIMYNRVTFPEINKTDKLTLTLVWRITF